MERERGERRIKHERMTNISDDRSSKCRRVKAQEAKLKE